MIGEDCIVIPAPQAERAIKTFSDERANMRDRGLVAGPRPGASGRPEIDG